MNAKSDDSPPNAIAAAAEQDPQADTVELRPTPVHPVASEPDRAPSGSRTAAPEFPGYRIEGVLGEGGMGIVYRARHLRLDRPVAIKAILGGAFVRQEAIDRMLNEIEAVARLRHPNLIQILDSGHIDGLPFYVMELVEGGHLGDRLAAHPPTIRQAAEICTRLARAIDHAHQQGIVHRDLKPSNVLITAEGDFKITDFGIAKRSDLERSMTMTGAVLGTPGYLSPEQAEGRVDAITPASDIFSLGVMLYEMITGRRPFEGMAEMEILSKIIEADPPSPAWYRPGIPRDLETICLKCLHKRPARRYATAGALADDLDRFLTDRIILARRTGRLERAIKWTRRHPAWATLLAALAVAIPGAIVGLSIANQQLSTVNQELSSANQQLSSQLARSQRLIENNRGLAQWVIDDHLKELDDLRGAAQAQFDLALRLKEFLEVTRAESTSRDELNHYLANAYEKVADVLGGSTGRHLGRVSEAAAAYRVAVGLLARLRTTAPSEEVDAHYARCLVKWAGVAWQIEGIDAAVQILDEAEPIVMEGFARNPERWTGYRLALAQSRFDVANALNDLKRATAILQEIDSLIEQHLEWNVEALRLSRESLQIWAASNQGILAARRREYEVARNWHLRELDLARQSIAQDPLAETSRDQLVTSLVHVSDALFQLGETEEALRLIEEAEVMAAQLQIEDPNNVYYLSHWALVLERQQRLHFQQSRFEKAIESATQCVTLRQRIQEIDPNNFENRRALRVGLSALADSYSQMERNEEARQFFAAALETAKPLAESPHAEPADWENLAEAYLGMGVFALKQWVAGLEDESAVDFLKSPTRRHAEECFRQALAAYDQIKTRAPLTSNQQAMRGSVEKYQQMIAEIAKSIEDSLQDDDL